MKPRTITRSSSFWIWSAAACFAVVQACGGSTEEGDDDFGGAPRPRPSASSSSSSGEVTSSSSGGDAGPGGLRITQLVTQAYHTCAVWSDGKLKCWGANSQGQLGLGDTEARGNEPGSMGDALPFVDVGQFRRVQRVSMGLLFTCALLDQGAVKCWGNNGIEVDGEGQNFGLGYGDTIARGHTKESMGEALPEIDLGGRAKDVACGSFSCCALLENDSVKCWGENFNGVLGYGDTLVRGDEPGEMGNALPPVDVGVGGVKELRVGHSITTPHACTVLLDGRLKCWGANVSGELGLGDIETRGDQAGEMGTALPNVPTGESVTTVGLGDQMTCAVLDTGRLRCWGSNAYGQLGVGDTNARGNVAGVALPLVDVGPENVIDVAADSHTCAVLVDGSVKCWGMNGLTLSPDAGRTPYGFLGYGDDQDRGDGPGEMGNQLPAVDLGTSERAEQITVGSGHTCVRFANQKVKCWGDNEFGTLGYGDTQTRGTDPSHMGAALPFVDLGR